MKKIVSMIAGLAATVAFAVEMPQVLTLSYSIQGAEKYADGSDLSAGECYALVWSEDGEFEGINGNGTPKGAGDEVIYIGQIAKNAAVSFQIAKDFKAGGTFEIWILDTRVFRNGEIVAIGKASGGSLTVTHAAKAVSAEVSVAGGPTVPAGASGIPGGVIAAPTAPASIPPLRFTSIKLDGNYVVMEADSTVPGVNYTTVVNGKEAGVTTATSDKIILIRPKEGDSAIIRGLAK